MEGWDFFPDKGGARGAGRTWRVEGRKWMDGWLCRISDLALHCHQDTACQRGELLGVSQDFLDPVTARKDTFGMMYPCRVLSQLCASLPNICYIFDGCRWWWQYVQYVHFRSYIWNGWGAWGPYIYPEGRIRVKCSHESTYAELRFLKIHSCCRKRFQQWWNLMISMDSQASNQLGAYGRSMGSVWKWGSHVLESPEFPSFWWLMELIATPRGWSRFGPGQIACLWLVILARMYTVFEVLSTGVKIT